MIVINNLTKIYKTKRKDQSIALNNVSLTLPDKGFIFVIGKSGSGKSTLLNMLGGLDDMTAGEIIADGNNLSQFSSEDFVKYRSSYLGFVFQYYNLLEEMTVEQNIELSLETSGVIDQLAVKKALEKVELSGYEKRYPKELSGGQRQRVAIARALARNPKLILGDEPTGNLDNKTSILVMELLKEISKEKLVVIVSHDLDSAYKYADRIIELHDGKVLSDKTRKDGYSNKFSVTDDEIILPYKNDLSKDEEKKLLYALKLNRFKNIKQLDNGFEELREVKHSNKKTRLKSYSLSKTSVFKLTRVFLNKRFYSSIVTMLIATLILIIIAMLQSFIEFDPNIYELNDDLVVLEKYDQIPFPETVYSSPLFDITDDEYKTIMSEVKEGKVYKLYNYNAVCKYENVKIYNGMTKDYKRNYQNLYCEEAYGTLNCDMEYLEKTFGENGELKFLCGEVKDDNCGIIITDYIADSILYHQSNLYKKREDLIGQIKFTNKVIPFEISAIIDTDYETRYGELIDKYKNEDKDPLFAYEELKKTPIYIDFIKEVSIKYGVGYNINPNFEEELANIELVNYKNIIGLTVKGNGITYQTEPEDYAQFKTRSTPKAEDGEVIVGYSLYNKWFGTSYNTSNLTELTPHDVTFEKYIDNDPSKGILFSKTYKISKLASSSGVFLSESDFDEIFALSVLNFGLYFDGVSNVSEIAYIAKDFNIHAKNIDLDNILVINKLLNVLIPFFKLILGMLVVFEFSYLISFGVNNIKKNLFEIGVIKSLGGKTKDISIIFITNVILSGIIICILSVIFSPLIIKLSNTMLVKSFENVLNLTIYDLNIVEVVPILIATNLVLVLLISFISAIISSYSLYKVKPIEIIKAKE